MHQNAKITSTSSISATKMHVYHRASVKGVQGLELHSSIFDENLNCTHQFSENSS